MGVAPALPHAEPPQEEAPEAEAPSSDTHGEVAKEGVVEEPGHGVDYDSLRDTPTPEWRQKDHVPEESDEDLGQEWSEDGSEEQDQGESGESESDELRREVAGQLEELHDEARHFTGYVEQLADGAFWAQQHGSVGHTEMDLALIEDARKALKRVFHMLPNQLPNEL